MSPLIPILGPLIDKVLDLIPNKNDRERERVKLEVAIMAAEAEQARGQAEINKQEAAHDSLFVAGWRPAIGWTLALALFAKYIGVPLLTWASSIWGLPLPPELELGDLVVLLGGMLGMGTLRTVEKRAAAKERARERV